MSKAEVKADTRTEFKLTEKANIIVSDSTHTIRGIRIPKGDNGETLISSSDPACNFTERISTIFMMAALDGNEQYRSEFVSLLDHIDFSKDLAALFAVCSVSNFNLQGNVKDKVESIVRNHNNFSKVNAIKLGRSASKGA